MIYKEEWRHIDENKLYMVSNLGNVLMIEHRDKLGRLQKERYKKKYKRTNGYLFVQIKVDGKNKCFDIHRLVAKAFISNPDNLPCINHKDENKENNTVYNLEWCTAKYNNNYGDRRKKASKNRKGKNCKKIQCIETGEIFKSAQDVIDMMFNGKGLPNYIRANIRGQRKSAYGYHFVYIERENY